MPLLGCGRSGAGASALGESESRRRMEEIVNPRKHVILKRIIQQQTR